MCTYHQLLEQRGLVNQQVEPLDENKGVVSKEQQLLFSEIERLMKKFECHCCALDFDQGFANAVIREKGGSRASRQLLNSTHQLDSRP
jgi:hypothetical protein